MKVIVITHEEFLHGEDELLGKIARTPVFKIHLRKPGANAETLQQFISHCSPELRKKLILHDWYDLVTSFSLGGYYFRAENLHRCKVYSNHKNSSKCLTTGIHTAEELQDLPDWITYAWISPVFPSISKKGYHKKWDYQTLTYALQSSKIPVFALGGIDATRIDQVRSMGFYGVAVKGAIWSASDPLNELNHILKKAGY